MDGAATGAAAVVFPPLLPEHVVMNVIGSLLGIGGTLATMAIVGFVMLRHVAPRMKVANAMFTEGASMIHARTAAARLRVTGIPAQARVVRIQPTGRWLNNQPECRVDLDVRLAYRQPYRASVPTILEPASIPRVRQGLNVPVKIDPGDLLHVVLDV